MIRITANTAEAERIIGKVQAIILDGSFDQPVEIAAWKVHRELVLLTPKKWTGMTRRSWVVKKLTLGQRLVFNTSKVMKWLELGTGNAGTPTSHGGYIYPKTKRFLFIPLTSSAAIGGWRPGMKFGTDYVLAKRVRGIRAMRIVEKFRPKAAEILKTEVKTFLERAIK